MKATEFLRAKFPGTLGKWLRAPDYAYMGGVNEACFRGLAAFGPEAKSAMPEIIACFEDAPGQKMAFYAVPLLIGELTNSDPHTLKMLTNALNRIDVEAAEKAEIK